MLDLCDNIELNGLIGGIQAGFLSAQEKSTSKATRKTMRERENPPVFDTVVEVKGHNDFNIFHNTADAVDVLMKGNSAMYEHRFVENDMIMQTSEWLKGAEI